MRKLAVVIALFFAHTAHAQLPDSISAADKVYGLSKFWQEVNYNFVYLDKVDRKAWDSSYKALITQVQQTTNDYDYYRLLLKFCALLKDGHTNIWYPGYINNMLLTKMFGEYWFGLQNIDGKAIITATLKTKMNELPIGSEITEVNGIPTDQYLKDSVEPYISSSTDYVLKDWAVSNMLQGLPGQQYKLKIKQPLGKVIDLTVTHSRTADTSFYPAFKQDSLLTVKWYKNNIAYVSLNSFGDEKIDTLFDEQLPSLYKAKALIIDLRKNGGGSTNIGTYILQYLTNDSVMQHSRYFTREHLGAFKAWGKYVQPKDTINNEWNKKAWLVNHDQYYYDFDYSPDTFHLNTKRLVVPTAILVSHNTASAAEDFLISADNQKHMVKIGQRSFGSTGQPFMFDMPGGGGARVCTKKDTYPDGREFVGYGVKPDIEINATAKDFIDGKDPVLDAALDYLNKQAAKL